MPKRIPKRPATVPDTTVWDDEEQEWQLGEWQHPKRGDPVRVGEWTYWRKDGALACVAHFDQKGNLDGINTRYHPDGTIASRGEWRRGDRFGAFMFVQSASSTPEPYPEDDRTWRVEFDATNNWSEDNQRFFLQDGRECTAIGRPLDSAFDLDTAFDRTSPEGFIAGDSAVVLSAFVESEDSDNAQPKVLSELGLDTIFGYQDMHVRPFLECLARAKISDFSDEDRGDSTTIYHDRLPGYGAWGAEKGDVNLMEWYLRNQDGNYYERLGQAFTGAYSIGRSGDSDPWYVGLYDIDDNETPTPRVYVWSHEGHGFGEPDYSSLDDFLWSIAAKEAHARTRLSDTGLARTLERLRPAPEQTRTRFAYWRAHWLIQLMDSHSVAYGQSRRLRDMRDEVFLTHLNNPIDDEVHRTRIDIGHNKPPTALYTLWRYFWFGHDSRLREAMDGFRKAPAKLTRDCVILIDELLDGRNQVASIDDVRALRTAFQALDLDPDRETQRNRERAVVATAQQQTRDQLRDSLPDIQKNGRDALLDRAWDVVDDWESLQILIPVLRQIPGATAVFDALDTVMAPADGKTASDKMIEAVAQWLGEHDTQLIQPLLWCATTDNSGLYPAVRQTLLTLATRRLGSAHPRLLQLALAELSRATEYNHNRETAARVLGQAATAQALPALLALFDEYHRATASLTGFDLRLSTIGWENILFAAANAIYAIHQTHQATPTDATLERMRAITSAYELHSMYTLTPVCLRVQGLLGDLAIIDAAGQCLRANDSDVQCLTLVALAELARNNSDSHVRLRDIDDPSTYSNLTAIAHALMRHAAAESIDMNQAIAAADEKSTYGSDSWGHYDRLVCEAVAHSKTDVSRLKPYLYAEDAEVRNAAVVAMSARKQKFDTPRVITPLSAQDLLSQGDGAVLTALHDPSAVGLHYLLEPIIERAPEDRPPGLVDALVGIGQREFQRLTPMPDDTRISETLWHALSALQHYRDRHEPRAFVSQCLQHPRPAVALAAIAAASPRHHTAAMIHLLETGDNNTAREASRWLLACIDDANVAVALKSAKMTAAKLKKIAG